MQDKTIKSQRRDVTRTIGAVGTYQAAALAIGLVTTIVLSRWLEPAGRGDFVLATLVATTVGLLLQFGLPASCTTFILRREYPTQVVFSNALTLALIRVFLSAVGVGVTALVWSKFRALGMSVLILVWGICATDVLLVLARGLLFSVGRLRNWALVDLSVSASFMILTATSWRLLPAHNAGYALLLYVIVRSGGLIFAAASLRGVVSPRPGLDRSVARALLKFGFRNLLNNLAWMLGPRMDMYVVGAAMLPADLGIYSIATGLSDKMTTILQTVPTGLYRFQATSSNEGNRVEQLTARALRISLILGATLAVGVAAVASLVVPFLFGHSYGPAIAPLIVLSVGALATVGLNIFQGYFTGFRMKPEVPALFGLTLAALGTVGNLLLVPRLGIIGAAVANLTAAAITFIPFAIYFRTKTGLKWRALFVPTRDDAQVIAQLLRTGGRWLNRKTNKLKGNQFESSGPSGLQLSTSETRHPTPNSKPPPPFLERRTSNAERRTHQSGLCIGCGVCAGVCPRHRIEMRFDRYGEYRPFPMNSEPRTLNSELRTQQSPAFTDHCSASCTLPSVCPFSDGSPNEDRIARAAFALTPGMQHRSETGYYLSCYAGHVASRGERLRRSSGGLATWLLKALLKQRIVDRVAQVAPQTVLGSQFLVRGTKSQSPPLFAYSLAASPSEVERAARSCYYPVELSQTIRAIHSEPGRYALIGLPCMLKAVRNAMACDERLRERIILLIGLTCGGTRSRHYADYLCSLGGSAPDRMSGADFRVKDADRPAGNFGFVAQLSPGESHPPISQVTQIPGSRKKKVRKIREIGVIGGCSDSGKESRARVVFAKDGWSEAWNRRYFEPDACGFCDDIFAEVADVALMDAWLEPYSLDFRGTSFILVRNSLLQRMLQQGADQSQIALWEVSVDDLIRSQQGAVQKKRNQLSERLDAAQRQHRYFPAKRVVPVRPSLVRILQIELEDRTRRICREVFAKEKEKGSRRKGKFGFRTSPLIPCPSSFPDRLRQLQNRTRLPIFALKVIGYLQARIAIRRPCPSVSVRSGPELATPSAQHPALNTQSPMIDFLFTGNGPMTNRGCEAIVLGTKRLLELEFGPIEITLASFAADDPSSLPADVHALALDHERPRLSRSWWQYQIGRALGRPEDQRSFLRPLIGELVQRRTSFNEEQGTGNEFAAALSIGGDGYSTDFGHFIVDRLIVMDDYVKSQGVPVIVWGASIGPFSADPEFEKQMARHLSRLDLVVVREPQSFRYLKDLGLGANLRLAPDPAFALPIQECQLPQDVSDALDAGCIGLNLSPLLSCYLTKGDLPQWQKLAAACIKAILNPALNTQHPTPSTILLIPHVSMMSRSPAMDDSVFLSSVLELLPAPVRDTVVLLPASLNSGQLKWVISRTQVFIGARAHAIMAALSTGVPCLSLAYSRKTRGINELVFGHTDWVMVPGDLSPERLGARIQELWQERAVIRSRLHGRSADLFDAACRIAGDLRSFVHCPLNPLPADRPPVLELWSPSALKPLSPSLLEPLSVACP